MRQQIRKWSAIACLVTIAATGRAQLHDKQEMQRALDEMNRKPPEWHMLWKEGVVFMMHLDYARALQKFESCHQILPFEAFDLHFECLVALERDFEAAALFDQRNELFRSNWTPESFETFISNDYNVTYLAYVAAVRNQSVAPYAAGLEAKFKYPECVLGIDMPRADTRLGAKIMSTYLLGRSGVHGLIKRAYELDKKVPFIAYEWGMIVKDRQTTLQIWKHAYPYASAKFKPVMRRSIRAMDRHFAG